MKRIDRAKPETQAIKAMSVIHKAGLVKSVGTYRNYQACLTAFTSFIKSERLGDLRSSTREVAERYLNECKARFSQKTLDMHRQAIQAHFHATGVLGKDEKLEVTKSEIQTKLEHRAYTKVQVHLVARHQTEKNAFSTHLAYACGLRAHELLTIRPSSEQPADIRNYEDGRVKSSEFKFAGREGQIYTVVGKGGLTREVLVPTRLVEYLESKRLQDPVKVTDRTVHYTKYYDLAGGQKWSNSFSKASNAALGWSTGAHGLRHSYAQERMDELKHFCNRSTALETVSQEMGHFREDITMVYMR